MTAWIMVLALTISSSIDNLGVGISYGIRGIRISHLSNLIISVICFLFSVVGIYFGLWLSKILPGIMPVVIGSFLLVVIGLRIILLAIPRKQEVSVEEVEYEVVATHTDVKSKIKDLTNAFGKSGSIGFIESILLGIGLSANALTNGLGAGLLGLPPIAICVAASIGSFVTVWGGVALGRKIAHIRIGKFTVGQFGTLISGALLLFIAFAAFFD
ncbi:sporulation membrane protein YtaF [Aneurinibacillus aneurinilyticus]|jgi:putative sporulation protein YtaF|uniref:Sporulation membrane protein YtaF n=2 Tax=Aneurinibacillus aneurinilyticus TaxID=1391 RepID=A0A848CV41_ANEAE|nr:sporulation membrane protein YtaF [Aneurinibacillus aneurinilyticus]ERI06836.1 putative sporulation protein YtaF [Aneurinibacillus aneurinilyticus ATCC 12856]MCI1695575.1 sporulation membrane protein YtaF [Aneurinibacillus aneurinilyticus]MED0673034.1 sporulation membrane protein YtaF [Aneurinibacillus aneurinilyticus]MED0705518.1 sporulation membrane protein YtaF [Aneurinibacillus aneurinilyticus]MED0722959.1 sporulation membrane protein YtaF [Aneurinibacillus aneurinilyticus]